MVTGISLNPALKRSNPGAAKPWREARALGIVRWLFAMAVLVRSYVDPAASAGQKESIALVYETLSPHPLLPMTDVKGL